MKFDMNTLFIIDIHHMQLLLLNSYNLICG